MKLHIISDLHNEFSMHVPTAASYEADVIVLAGDIWKNSRGIGWARETWPNHRIIYVAGNHEFYGKVRAPLLAQLRVEAKACDVDFLENDEVIIDGIRFLGATLWTDFQLLGEKTGRQCMFEAQQYMTDFRVIHEGRRHFSPMDSVVLHKTSVEFIKTKLDTHFDGKTVVVTHHLPSQRSVALRFIEDTLSPCFASDLDYLLDGKKADLWIHGHTHDNFDYVYNGLRIVCNPRGYVTMNGTENTLFNASFIVEV